MVLISNQNGNHVGVLWRDVRVEKYPST